MALPKPTFTEADVHSIRAFLAGTATPDQQRRAAKFILEDICHIFDSPYIESGVDRDSFVMMGRHQVGVLITSTQTAETLQAARAADLAKIRPTPEPRGTRQRHAKS